MTTHTHNCAATGCQKQVPFNLLMCMTHWRMVPAPVQREVLAAWRLMNRDRRNLDAVLVYRTQCLGAQQAVHAKQHRKIAEKNAVDGNLFKQIGL